MPTAPLRPQSKASSQNSDSEPKNLSPMSEREPFTQDEFLALMALARKGVGRLVDLQKLAVA